MSEINGLVVIFFVVGVILYFVTSMMAKGIIKLTKLSQKLLEETNETNDVTRKLLESISRERSR